MPFLSRRTKVPEVNQGALFHRRRDHEIVETANVIAVTPDAAGYPDFGTVSQNTPAIVGTTPSSALAAYYINDNIEYEGGVATEKAMNAAPWFARVDPEALQGFEVVGGLKHREESACGGEVMGCVGVTSASGVQFSVELVGGVLPDGLEEPVATHARGVVVFHQRFRDE